MNTERRIEKMEKWKRQLKTTVMIGGALALAACDSSLSAEEVIENSLESYDGLEGYTQELTMD